MSGKSEKKEKKSFDAIVDEALRNINDERWLGKHSILATPYFLGKFLRTSEMSKDVLARGRAVQRLLREAHKQIWARPTLPHTKEELRAIANEQDYPEAVYRFL